MRRRTGCVLLAGALTSSAASSLVGCGASEGGPSTFDNPVPDASLPPIDGGTSGIFADGGGTPDAAPSTAFLNALEIAPANSVLEVDVPGAPVQLAYTAKLRATGAPQPNAAFFLDSPEFGTFDTSGHFTPSGTTAGVTTVYAESNGYFGTTRLTIRLKLRENAANLSSADQDALRAGGTADSLFKWLYPYDKTVFPRGLLPPTLQFAGTVPDAFRMTAKSANFDYEGFYPASDPARLSLSSSLWRTLTLAGGASDPVTIGITKRSAGAVTGPSNETWTMAEGSLKGTVYYNSYKSVLAGNYGVVFRIKPGAASPELLTTDVTYTGACTVCHSVSANGSVMVAARGFTDALDAGAYLPPTPSGSENTYIWNLQPDGGKDLRRGEDRGRFTFGALTPDGTMVMTAGVSAPRIIGPDGGVLSGDPYDNQLRGTDQPGPTLSKLVDTQSGADIATAGFDNIMAYTPAFSPDGRHIAFSYYNFVGPAADGGRTLAMMDFDQASKTFSNLVTYTEPGDGGQMILAGWPAFTPDSQRVIYQAGPRYVTVGLPDAVPPRSTYAVLKEYDLASKSSRVLDALNGGGPAAYLPFETSPPTEARMAYEPTILPVASGGYFWVVFTSRRQFGNTINDPDAFEDPFASDTSTGRRKKMWVAAIDLNPAPGTDPSHPAFYLEGQELQAGNLRAFWALDPCKSTGAVCTNGADCCGGFCRPAPSADGGLAFSCVPKPVDCAQEFEQCGASTDCCEAASGVRCIAGHCASPVQIK